jgi:hypothetical protein
MADTFRTALVHISTLVRFYILVEIISPWRWRQYRPKHVVENIVDTILQKHWSAFVGYLYILDQEQGWTVGKGWLYCRKGVDLPLSLQPNAGIISQIKPRESPFTLFQIHYSSTNLPFYAVKSKFRKSWINKNLEACGESGGRDLTIFSLRTRSMWVIIVI